MLIILRLAVLPHKHPHELLDSVVKEQWLSLSSQPRRAFYSTSSFRQVVFRSSFPKKTFLLNRLRLQTIQHDVSTLKNFMLILIDKPPTCASRWGVWF